MKPYLLKNHQLKKIPGFLLILILAGCGKDDVTAPVISLESPTDHATIAAGMPLVTKGTITDDEGIHMVHLLVTDLSNSGHVVHNEEHTDGKTYNLFNSFTSQPGRSYHIHIDATDHANNITNKDLTVTIN
jgi:hypothetical protein